MKNNWLVIICILQIFIFSCEKNNKTDLFYDCYVKTEISSDSQVIVFWDVDYYKADRLIRHEDSYGYFYEYEFDNQGNVISRTTDSHKEIYEYDVNNNLTKESTYISGQLDYYFIYTYKDNLKISSYMCNNNNDTTSWSNYYYNNADKLDSIVSENSITRFYYSYELDSIISTDEEGKITNRRLMEYSQSKKIYDANYQYLYSGELWQYYIETWEYNDAQLLTRATEERWIDTPGENYWSDERYLYNESNEIIRKEFYNQNDNIIAYYVYNYESHILINIQIYNGDDILTSTAIIENTCGKQYTTANRTIKSSRSSVL